jgi:mannitol-1-phosphate 5-dehydrogenase
MAKHIFTGFGFGPIQGGLFVDEAYASGNFSRIVIAEIDQKLVDAVRAGGGSYSVNIARKDRIDVVTIRNVELLNPNVESDRNTLIEALRQSTEIVTSLPSVAFFEAGAHSVASLIAEGLQKSTAEATIIYAAENNNHAAEILEKAVAGKIGGSIPKRAQFLNTVIGKMSQVVTDSAEIKQKKLTPIVPGIDRAFLVEEFNRILVTRCTISGFTPGIKVFIEKDDLLPFEEAKLYGHNAIHALLAYLGAIKGYGKMMELKNDTALMAVAQKAFLDESGVALIKKYRSLGDELFTEAGYKNYAFDLLERMTNSFLADTIDRAGRDPLRKLSLNDRIFGTMALVLEQGVEPANMAMGAMAGIGVLLQTAKENKLPADLQFGDWQKLNGEKIEKLIKWIWQDKTSAYAPRLISHVVAAQKRLAQLM